jgi:hypothetical protein
MTTERIKEIQMETAYPDSVSVQQALLKVWNECVQSQKAKEMEELNDILKKEGKQKTHQFQEWWDVFEILSYGRKLELSELEIHSILSNRFKLERR